EARSMAVGEGLAGWSGRAGAAQLGPDGVPAGARVVPVVRAVPSGAYAPLLREQAHQQQAPAAFALRVALWGVVDCGSRCGELVSLVGHLEPQPKAVEPEGAPHLVAVGVPYGVGDQFRDQQSRVVTALVVDAPLEEPVEHSSTRLRHGRLQGGQPKGVTER